VPDHATKLFESTEVEVSTVHMRAADYASVQLYASAALSTARMG